MKELTYFDQFFTLMFCEDTDGLLMEDGFGKGYRISVTMFELEKMVDELTTVLDECKTGQIYERPSIVDDDDDDNEHIQNQEEHFIRR